MNLAELATFDIPFEGLELQSMAWVREALELRHGAAGDPEGPLTTVNPTEGHQAVEQMLVRVRVRSDRVDELLSKATLARGRARRAQEHAKFVAEQAYDTAQQENSARRTVEFTTREERNAEAALDSLEERRLAHMSERLVSVTTDVYEVVNQIHWQLDSIRKDLRATLHSLQFESSLER